MATQAIKSSKTVEPEEVRQALERILGSKYFVHAPKKQGFLNLICEYYLEGRAHELNEYILAYDVFNRESTYDPSADTVVRVTAHEIRKKLEHYYQGEGANDPVRLEIPVGSYQPIFTRHQPASLDTEADPLAPAALSVAGTTAPTGTAPRGRRLPPATLVLSLATLALAVAAAVLWLSNRELRRQMIGADAARDRSPYGAVWASFMKDSAPPLVILSNPPALRLSNASDPEVLGTENIPLSPEAVERLKDRLVTNPEVVVKDSTGNAGTNEGGGVHRQSQTPRLVISTDVFTGTGEAIGLHYLTKLFHGAGRGILLKQSRTLSAEDLKNHNVIMLGGVWVNEWSGKLAEIEDFVFTNNATIRNRDPQPGEAVEYIPQFDGRTGGLMVDYALVTVKPNISDANVVMTLAGIRSQGTEAAAEFVTNKNYLAQLNQRLQQVGSPRYYQVLLKVGVENGIPTTISILALHELRRFER